MRPYMVTLSNGLSFARAPLALLFLQSNPALRVAAIFLAMLTDSIDGYLARRYDSASRFGAFFDPAMDKFFVYFALCFLWLEGNIELWQALAMLSRDFALCLFGIYLLISKRWRQFYCQAIRWGKITTAMQFLALIALTMCYSFSWLVYALFILFGTLAFVELWQIPQTKQTNS